ncbi:MAG: ABC transporter permease [Actinomycetota bacterium]|nr:ABC transporter permease [Actinomycetota bacterium]
MRAGLEVGSTVVQDTAIPAWDELVPDPDSRSWARAYGDLAAGWQQRRLWGHLGLQDVRQGYRRSVLGPLWITISMAVTAFALGILYSALFAQDLRTFLPYVATGLIIWTFIAGCINQGTEVFIRNEGLIKHLPSPLSVHVYRMVWHQVLLFAHNLAVYAVLMAIFPRRLGFEALLAIPALAVIVANGLWVAFLVGIIATRFRDIPPVMASLVQLMFFMTPIVWVYADFRDRGGTVAERARLAEFNPFLHFLEILRAPMIGDPIVARHWIVALAITVLGWALALLAMRNYRARVPYWV